MSAILKKIIAHFTPVKSAIKYSTTYNFEISYVSLNGTNFAFMPHFKMFIADYK